MGLIKILAPLHPLFPHYTLILGQEQTFFSFFFQHKKALIRIDLSFNFELQRIEKRAFFAYANL